MITNLLKNGLSSFESISIKTTGQGGSGQKQGNVSEHVKLEKIVEETLKVLSSILE